MNHKDKQPSLSTFHPFAVVEAARPGVISTKVGKGSVSPPVDLGLVDLVDFAVDLGVF
jgi:hypothetical protein